MKKAALAMFFAAALTLPSLAPAAVTMENVNDRLIGAPRKKLIRKFGERHLRSYQTLGEESSITFVIKDADTLNPVTFYLTNGIVTRFQANDREEMAKQYMSEFASGNILHNYPKVRTALLNALMKLPLEMYLEITDRRRPVIFLDYYTNGIAKYAGSVEFRMRETDPPTFEDGFYIIRLGDALNETETPEAIEGVILHEIMHRVREDLRNDAEHPCVLEQQTNRMLKELGFEKEYSLASAEFGSKGRGDSPCADLLMDMQQKAEDPAAATTGNPAP